MLFDGFGNFTALSFPGLSFATGQIAVKDLSHMYVKGIGIAKMSQKECMGKAALTM